MDAVSIENGKRLAADAAARHAAWAAKNPEQAERNRLTREEYAADRSAAIAEGNGWRFDIEAREFGGSMTTEDQRDLAELRRASAPLAPVTNSKIAA